MAADSAKRYSFSKIRLIVGLGNPGPQFMDTRHNVGFNVVDGIAVKFGTEFRYERRCEAEVAEVLLPDSRKIWLLKPQTYMNLSGKAVACFVKKHGITPEEVLVVHDDIDRKLARLSLVFGGSSRGHNGVKDIIAAVGDGFWRLRFGVGRPERKEDVPKYVLSEFPRSELEEVALATREAVEKILM